MKLEYFTPHQLDSLRQKFSQIERVSVDEGSTGDKMMRFMDTLPVHLLKQLADARIKFVSPLAANRVLVAEDRKARAA